MTGVDPDDLPPRLNPRRAHGRPIGRLAPRLAVVLSVVILLATVSGWSVTTYYDHRIHRTGISTADDADRPPPGAHGTANWLLVGSDVRTGSDAARIQGARSDTMMIAHMSADGTTTAVSVPRDLRVRVPSWTDSDGQVHKEYTDKVNAAFNSGGPPLLVATLEGVTGLRIDHFAEIDFSGFTSMSAALGGVDVCIAPSSYVEPFRMDNGRLAHATNIFDPNSGFRGHDGVNHLSGAQALAFVRQRHGFVDGDLSRIKRQQAFLGAVFRKVVGGNTLLNPAKLTAFLNSVTESITVDSNTNLNDLRRLATSLRGMGNGQVRFTTIPIAGQVNSPVFYFLYDSQQVKTFFQELDRPAGAPAPPAPSAAAPAPAATTAPVPAVSPSDMRVNVLNGSRVSGVANSVATKLRKAGFRLGTVGNAPGDVVDQTEVRYPANDPEGADAAKTLVARFPGAVAAADGDLAAGTYSVVVGTDIASGAGGAGSSPTPAPKPIYTQKPVTAAAGCVL